MSDTLVRYDDAPFSLSTSSNWIARHGGLPPYVRAVARGIMRSGHSESEAIQMAIGVMANWVADPKTTPKTKAKATAALAWWEALKAATKAGDAAKDASGDRHEAVSRIEQLLGKPVRIERRDGMGGLTEGSSAGLLLPVGPTKAKAKQIEDEETEGREEHSFSGSDLMHCATCGEPIHSSIHTEGKSRKAPGQPIPPVPRMLRDDSRATFAGGESRRMTVRELSSHLVGSHGYHRSQVNGQRRSNLEASHNSEHESGNSGHDHRHAGPDHAPVPSGHIKGNADRHSTAAKASFAAHISSAEPSLERSMRAYFGEQRQATINRLNGKRGKQMMKRAAAAMALVRADPGSPGDPGAPDVSGVEPPAPAAPPIDPQSIFDSGYWAQKLQTVLQPHLDNLGNTAASMVQNQLGGTPGVDDGSSIGAVQGILAQRAQQAAQHITGTTADQLAGALQEGVANGEGMQDIAKRVNAVFDNADKVRAKTIAQTEVIGALNQAANEYASKLPENVVASKRWLSHHDDRTRPTHRDADGQEVSMGSPYYVGGSPMMFPGDPAAPISEWINCRCSQAFLPGHMAQPARVAAAAAGGQ